MDRNYALSRLSRYRAIRTVTSHGLQMKFLQFCLTQPWNTSYNSCLKGSLTALEESTRPRLCPNVNPMSVRQSLPCGPGKDAVPKCAHSRAAVCALAQSSGEVIMRPQRERELDDELFLAGERVRPGTYRQLGGVRMVRLDEDDFLPASLDGRVACYMRVQNTWEQISRHAVVKA